MLMYCFQETQKFATSGANIFTAINTFRRSMPIWARYLTMFQLCLNFDIILFSSGKNPVSGWGRGLPSSTANCFRILCQKGWANTPCSVSQSPLFSENRPEPLHFLVVLLWHWLTNLRKWLDFQGLNTPYEKNLKAATLPKTIKCEKLVMAQHPRFLLNFTVFSWRKYFCLCCQRHLWSRGSWREGFRRGVGTSGAPLE